MSLYNKASIVLAPGAYKEGRIFNQKPLSEHSDLKFDRGTSGSVQTRNESGGYIQSVGLDVPRIDYQGGVGYLLMEQEATNTATYSNDFTQGVVFNGGTGPQLQNDATLAPNQGISPDGTNNAWKLGVGTTDESFTHLRLTNMNVISNNVNVLSVFAKKGSGVDWFGIFADGYDGGNHRAWFDLENGTKGALTNGLNSTIEDYGNGWYRCSLAFSSTTDLVGNIRLVITDGDQTSNYIGTLTDHHLMFGLQAESTSTSAYDYPTSYIPTSGSSETRASESATGGGYPELFNDSEGVFYAELASFTESGLNRFLSISNGTNSEAVRIKLGSASNRIDAVIRDGNSTVVSISHTTSDITDFNKIAIKYKSGDTALWVGGVERVTSTVTFALNGLYQLALDQSQGSSPFYGKIKCIAVFKEALTDTELQELTS